jgi:hypothetical protein
VDWLKNEVEKDQKELEIEKNKIISSIKELSKKDIFKDKEKLTLWKKIKKVLMGF